MNLIKTNAWLLLICGVIILIPAIHEKIKNITPNSPIILILLGIFSITVSGTIIIKKLYK
jgi:hypothetical protein